MTVSPDTAGASIGLQNPKSPTNVGAVLRAAGCFGADAIQYSGSRFERARKFHLDTQDRHRAIPLLAVGCLLEQRPAHRALVCIELVEGAVALPQFIHPAAAHYVFGPEDGSLDQRLIDAADAVVYIPTLGCLNLAASVNIVLYDREVKRGAPPAGDPLIRASRDTNNRLRWRRRPAAGGSDDTGVDSTF